MVAAAAEERGEELLAEIFGPCHLRQHRSNPEAALLLRHRGVTNLLHFPQKAERKLATTFFYLDCGLMY